MLNKASEDMAKDKGKSESKETKLSEHKRLKKELTPPLLQIPKLSPSSWLHRRMPEMLWAALIIGNIERKSALDFFRYVASYVAEHQECFDITLTGISKLKPDEINGLLKHMDAKSKEISEILRLITVYTDLPAREEWVAIFGEADSKNSAQKVSNGVLKTLDHQSQESTDCRWIKLLCMMTGGRMKFPRESSKQIEELFYYPDKGDMTEVRPSIRALEINLSMGLGSEDSEWSKRFWKFSYQFTDCYPEEAYSKKIANLREDFAEHAANKRDFYVASGKKVRDRLIEHLFDVAQDSKLDCRQETAFGFAFYSVVLFTEINFYNNSHSILGRMGLRSLVEIYVSFKHLLQEEKTKRDVWDDFYFYGTGQAKLIYLKLKELKVNPQFLSMEELNEIVNEEKWLEFIPINLGQWGNSDLRTMSEKSGIKDIYDRYYHYTSSYVHGTGLAIRESIYQRCLNPLHRLHRIPIFDLTLRPSIVKDTAFLVNKILDCLEEAYPKFDFRIEEYENNAQMFSMFD